MSAFSSVDYSDGAAEAPLLFIGANPALQKTYEFAAPPALGSVHRVKSVTTGVGGKGQNAASDMCCLTRLPACDTILLLC